MPALPILLPGQSAYGISMEGVGRVYAELCRKKKEKTDSGNPVGYSGIGIRTPTYRVRVCCATFTQYRYLYIWFGRSQLFVFSSSRRIKLYHILSLLSTPFSKKVEIFLIFFRRDSCGEFLGWRVPAESYSEPEKFFGKIVSTILQNREKYAILYR